MEREFEAKGLISQKDFEKLVDNLEINEIRQQQNTYIDTKDGFFKSQMCALRLRIIDGKYIFSLKRQDTDGATEWNDELSELQFNQIISTASINLSTFKCPYNEVLDNLQIVTISTKRYVCNVNGYSIELDVTTFGDTIDYEIEIESENLIQAEKIMDTLVKEYSLDIKKSYPKIARYFMYN